MTLTYSRYFVTAGQSYGREGYNNGYALAAFNEAVRRVLVADPAGVQSKIGGSPSIAGVVGPQVFQLANGAFDGSAVLEKHKSSADNYWLENDGSTSGPRLTSIIATISAQTLDRSVVLYSHGEQDSGFTTTTTLADEVAAGMTTLLLAIRTALLPAGPNGLPVFWDMLGPRFAGNEMNEYRLRDAMIDEIDSLSRNIRGAEKYALRLDSTTHPSEDMDGYGRMGAWTGRKVAQWLTDLGELRGPQIGTVTRSGSTVTVPITVPAGKTLIKPTDPDFLGLWDGSGNRLGLVSQSWSGDTLTVVADGTPATFRYPARSHRPFDLSNIIRLSDPVDPLYTGEPGLPLESKKTVTLA